MGGPRSLGGLKALGVLGNLARLETLRGGLRTLGGPRSLCRLGWLRRHRLFLSSRLFLDHPTLLLHPGNRLASSHGREICSWGLCSLGGSLGRLGSSRRFGSSFWEREQVVRFEHSGRHLKSRASAVGVDMGRQLRRLVLRSHIHHLVEGVPSSGGTHEQLGIDVLSIESRGGMRGTWIRVLGTLACGLMGLHQVLPGSEWQD